MEDEVVKKRLEVNREILRNLSDWVEKYPELRFCQILHCTGIVSPQDTFFYRESTDTLQNMCKN